MRVVLSMIRYRSAHFLGSSRPLRSFFMVSLGRCRKRTARSLHDIRRLVPALTQIPVERGEL